MAGPEFVRRLFYNFNNIRALSEYLINMIDSWHSDLIDNVQSRGLAPSQAAKRGLRRFAFIWAIGSAAVELEVLPVTREELGSAVVAVTEAWLRALPQPDDEESAIQRLRDYVLRYHGQLFRADEASAGDVYYHVDNLFILTNYPDIARLGDASGPPKLLRQQSTALLLGAMTLSPTTMNTGTSPPDRRRNFELLSGSARRSSARACGPWPPASTRWTSIAASTWPSRRWCRRQVPLAQGRDQCRARPGRHHLRHRRRRDRRQDRPGDGQDRQRGCDHRRGVQGPGDRVGHRREHAVRPRLPLAVLRYQRGEDDGRNRGTAGTGRFRSSTMAPSATSSMPPHVTATTTASSAGPATGIPAPS